MLRRPLRPWSATIITFCFAARAVSFARTPPRLPALAPSSSRISSGCAARIGARDELIRFRATHRSRRSFDDREFNSAAREDVLVSFALIAERFIQPFPINVERVSVLHDEGAQAHQARLWPRLVAKLDLNLIPNLRQLLVRTDFITRY